jgi:hypothetical protein
MVTKEMLAQVEAMVEATRRHLVHLTQLRDGMQRALEADQFAGGKEWARSVHVVAAPPFPFADPVMAMPPERSDGRGTFKFDLKTLGASGDPINPIGSRDNAKIGEMIRKAWEGHCGFDPAAPGLDKTVLTVTDKDGNVIAHGTNVREGVHGELVADLSAPPPGTGKALRVPDAVWNKVVTPDAVVGAPTEPAMMESVRQLRKLVDGFVADYSHAFDLKPYDSTRRGVFPTPEQVERAKARLAEDPGLLRPYVDGAPTEPVKLTCVKPSGDPMKMARTTAEGVEPLLRPYVEGPAVVPCVTVEADGGPGNATTLSKNDWLPFGHNEGEMPPTVVVMTVDDETNGDASTHSHP